MKNTINLAELKNLLNYFIDNNRRLKDEGKKPISINIESDAGIGE